MTSRARPLRLATHVVGGSAAAVGLVVVLPRIAGVPWHAVADTVLAVPAWALVALVLLWAAGLLAHTTTLTAALPGLTRRRALLLSLTGSAVANVLPLGGAAGVALNYRMTRRWGFSPAGSASYTVVTNLWDVLAKLVLPAVVLPLLVHGVGLPVPAGLGRVLVAAAVALPLVAAAAGALLATPALARRLGARVERGRAAAAGVVRSAWQRLSVGMLLYTALLFALLLACLTVTGADVAVPVVLIAFCAERLATLVNLTPGGLGVVEVGLIGALVLVPGAAAAGVAGGVLLYRVLTFGLEIPVGGALLAGWLWLVGREDRAASRAASIAGAAA